MTMILILVSTLLRGWLSLSATQQLTSKVPSSSQTSFVWTWVAVSSPAISGVPDGVCSLLVNLLACYYVWDLTYPRSYQLLVFLQQHLLGDTKERLFKASSLIKFEKLFSEAVERQC